MKNPPFLTECNILRDAKKMARDVHNQLLNIIRDYGKMDQTEAETYVIGLENSFRYQKDVWS